MDLTKFDVKGAAGAGAKLHLSHPSNPSEKLFCADGETPFTVTVMGRDANAVQKVVTETNRARAAGEIDEEKADALILAATICGWSDEMEMDGKPFPYSPDNALKLVTDERTFWIVEQVAPFSISRKNFLVNMDCG